MDDGSQPPSAYATVRHSARRGYGAALKSGIRAAKAPYVATMDGDFQHTFTDVKRIWEFIQYFPENEMVIGDRRVHETETKRWIGRKVLNTIGGLFAWKYLPDLNSGLRIFNRSTALGYEPILCDTFSFTSSITLSMLCDNYKVDWLPIRVQPRRHGKSRVRPWRDGWITLKIIFRIGLALRTRKLRGFFRRIISAIS